MKDDLNIIIIFSQYFENQPPSSLNSGDSYEEDLKIRIWKTNSR